MEIFTAMAAVQIAAKHESMLVLAATQVAELDNVLRAQEDDIFSLREANRDWADTAADLRDDVREARRYTNILEAELTEAESALRFANDTTEILLKRSERD